jgi:hypothetical protein
MHLSTGHCQAQPNFSQDLYGIDGPKLDLKLLLTPPNASQRVLGEWQSPVLPVLRCTAESRYKLKGGRFSRLISAGRDYGADREHGT